MFILKKKESGFVLLTLKSRSNKVSIVNVKKIIKTS